MSLNSYPSRAKRGFMKVRKAKAVGISRPEASVELSLQAELYWELGIVSDWNYHGHAISRPETYGQRLGRERRIHP